jgi:hypothetical protein
VTEDFERLTDEAWAGELESGPAADAEWAAPFIAR